MFPQFDGVADHTTGSKKRKRHLPEEPLTTHPIDDIISAAIKQWCQENKQTYDPHLPYKSTLYRQGYRHGYAACKNLSAKREAKLPETPEPKAKRQKIEKSNPDLLPTLTRAWKIKTEHPDVWKDLLARLNKAGGPMFEGGCRLVTGKNDRISLPLLPKYGLPLHHFGTSLYAHVIAAVEHCISKPSEYDEASHICHRNRCTLIGHVVAESDKDNKLREGCRKRGECKCGLSPPCIVDRTVIV